DDDPESERSARALEQLYVDAAEWTELARLYRRRLKTLGTESVDADGNNAERLRIWGALADLCIGPLGDPDSASLRATPMSLCGCAWPAAMVGPTTARSWPISRSSSGCC